MLLFLVFKIGLSTSQLFFFLVQVIRVNFFINIFCYLVLYSSLPYTFRSPSQYFFYFSLYQLTVISHAHLLSLLYIQLFASPSHYFVTSSPIPSYSYVSSVPLPSTLYPPTLHLFNPIPPKQVRAKTDEKNIFFNSS